MLKFNLKPTKELSTQEIQCYNVSVSPDLSYISGRTSHYNSILDGEMLKIVNNGNKFTNLCKVNAKDVKIQGKVLLSINLPIKTVTKRLSKNELEIDNYTKRYVEYDNAFSYEYSGAYLVDGKIYHEDSSSSTALTINTFAYIEDGVVKIGDTEYIADFRGGENEEPEIKESKYATKLVKNVSIPGNNNIKFLGVVDYTPDKWRRETVFSVWKDADKELGVDEVLFGAYEHYITYEGENYRLSEMYDESGSYKGYGVYINNTYYTDISRQVYGDAIYEEYDNTIQLESSLLTIGDEYYIINDSLVSPKNNGQFVLIITSSDKLDIKEGDTIIAKSNGIIRSKLEVNYDSDESSNPYVTYMGKRYDVKEGLYKYITISDKEYELLKDADDYYAYVCDNKMYFTVSGNKAIPTNKIYYSSGNDIVKYGKYEDGYEIVSCSGVTINDKKYRVYDTVETRPSPDDLQVGYEIVNPYVIISEDASYNLTIEGKNGSSTYICYPYVDNGEIYDNGEAAAIQRYISDLVVTNRDNFTFYVRNDVFGEQQIYSDTYLYDAVVSTKPFCSKDVLNLSIYKINAYANFKLPIVNSTANNLLRDDIIKTDFSNAVSDKSRTNIVDMEKDVYYPVWRDGSIYHPITKLKFNMHFRTRQLDNWKVIEDYAENDSNDMSNWFITDYAYYKEALTGMTGGVNKTLHNASDIIGFMNFTTSEAKNRAKKISKSFLRLSFYSTNNPQTQVLLGTSTIFMDDALLCKKIVSLQKNADAGKFIDVKQYELNEDTPEKYECSEISANSEYENDDEKYNFKNYEYFRLSSSLNVYDRNMTDNSSEGFYFYMFREYANNMRPLTIYLRIDFNHAGIGKTIPFMLPRNENGYPLYIHNPSDLEKLKQGFTLKDIYKQLYIPINVIYDDKTNRYVYYLPNELRENNELGVDDDIMEFNLFEVKFKDESNK